ncbi:MAG: TfoX/Sxy family protein [Stappiaceae bacterium]
MQETIDAEGFVDRIRNCLPPHSVTEKKMFGGTCFLLNGNMLCMAGKSGLTVRVGKEGEQDALAQPHAQRSRPGGRHMTGFVSVDHAGTDDDAQLKAWLDRAWQFVNALPAK